VEKSQLSVDKSQNDSFFIEREAPIKPILKKEISYEVSALENLEESVARSEIKSELKSEIKSIYEYDQDFEEQSRYSPNL